MHAFLEVDEGDPRKAVEEFRSLAAGDSLRVESVAGLVLALSKAGRAEEALDVLDRQPPDAASVLAFAVLRQRTLEKLRRPVPPEVATRAAAQATAAVEYFVLGEEALARGHAGEPAAFERAFDFLTRAVTHPRVQARFHLARAHALGHLGRKRQAEAREAARFVQAAMPDWAVAWYWSAFAVHLFDPDAAIASYCKAIEIDASFLTAHLNLAYLLRTRGRHEESLAPARRAVALDPAHPGAWKNVVAALRGLKRYDEIEEPLERCRQLAPEDLETWYAIGMVRSDQGRTDEAIAALRAAVRLDPKHPFAANNLARLIVGRDGAEAEKLFRVALESSLVAPHAAVNLGAMLIDERRHREAVEVVSRGLGPGLPASLELDLRRKLAIAAAGASDWTRAEAALARVVELAPDDAQAWCDLGTALGRLHRHQDALAATLRGQEIGSDRPDWKHPGEAWIEERRRRAEQERRVLEAEAGRAVDSRSDEALELAAIAVAKRLDLAAFRCFERACAEGAAAFTSLPIADRTHAVLAGLRVSAAADGPASRTSWDARARDRGTALRWLREELAAPAGDRAAILSRLDDPALARLRGDGSRSHLPDAEWREWDAYFSEVHQRFGGSR
jgi:tetratricopeptide (TPR) repeat protein